MSIRDTTSSASTDEMCLSSLLAPSTLSSAAARLSKHRDNESSVTPFVLRAMSRAGHTIRENKMDERDGRIRGNKMDERDGRDRNGKEIKISGI